MFPLKICKNWWTCWIFIRTIIIFAFVYVCECVCVEDRGQPWVVFFRCTLSSFPRRTHSSVTHWWGQLGGQHALPKTHMSSPPRALLTTAPHLAELSQSDGNLIQILKLVCVSVQALDFLDQPSVEKIPTELYSLQWNEKLLEGKSFYF